MNLRNKHILLTGATGGLGTALALQLASHDVVLGLVGRDLNKLEALKTKLAAYGCHAHCVVADFSQSNASQQMIANAKQAMGHIDILINNAGILDFVALQNQSEERIINMINTNVSSLILNTRALLPDLLKQNQGHLVFIGSIFGSLGFPHYATYCASKFAVHGFSQALRRELINTKIGVTYIAPRAIATPMNAQNTVDMLKKAGQQMDTPETVANIIIDALQNKKQEVFIGQPQSFFAWLNAIAPKLINIGLKKQTTLAERFLQKQSSS